MKEFNLSEKRFITIPELGISVEIEVHDKNKSYDDLNLKEREDELLTIEECIFLANTPKYAKLLKMDGSSTKDDFFIKQPFELNKKNGYIARFVAYDGGAGLYCDNWGPSGRNSDLGVRFKRKLKGGKKK